MGLVEQFLQNAVFWLLRYELQLPPCRIARMIYLLLFISLLGLAFAAVAGAFGTLRSMSVTETLADVGFTSFFSKQIAPLGWSFAAACQVNPAFAASTIQRKFHCSDEFG